MMKTTLETNKTVHILKTASEYLHSLPEQLDKISAKVPDGWHQLNIPKGEGVEFFPELMEVVETTKGIKEAINAITISSLTIKEEIIDLAENPEEVVRMVDDLNRKYTKILKPDFPSLRNHRATNKLLLEDLINNQFLIDLYSIIEGIDFYQGIIHKAIEELREDYAMSVSNNSSHANDNAINNYIQPKDTILNNSIVLSLLRSMQKEGLLDVDFQWRTIDDNGNSIKHTNYEKAIFAAQIGQKASISNWNQAFCDLWKLSDGTLSEAYYDIERLSEHRKQYYQEKLSIFK